MYGNFRMCSLLSLCRGNFADSSKGGHSFPLIKQCHLCCVQYIAECYYNTEEECDKNWHGVCVALEPVTEMLMSFLMSLPPAAAALSDLYAVAAAFFISGGASSPPAVFAQELDTDAGIPAAELPLSQGDGAGAGHFTPTASVCGGGMSVGSQSLLSPAAPPPAITRPSSARDGGGRVVPVPTAASAAPKRYTPCLQSQILRRLQDWSVMSCHGHFYVLSLTRGCSPSSRFNNRHFVTSIVQVHLLTAQ
jgi:hypothetical protein